MALINRFKGKEGELKEQSGCLCKHRGVPEDYPNGIPEDWAPDKDYDPTKRNFDTQSNDNTDVPVSNTPVQKKSIVDDITFGEIVGLINHLVKENKEFVNKMNDISNKLLIIENEIVVIKEKMK